MPRKLNAIFFVFLSAATVSAQSAVPATPAGRVLTAWLDAFNSGDRARIDAFIKSYDPSHPQSFMTSAQFRGQSGGIKLAAIERSEPAVIVFRAQENAQPTMLMGKITLNAGKQPTIRSFMLSAVPDGAVADDLKLDAAVRKQIIDDVVSNLNEFYVFPAAAQKMADALRAHQDKGDYNAINDGEDFAGLLTAHLVEVSHDKHLRVFYNPYKFTGEITAPTTDQVAETRKDMARDCGFRRLEILPNNVGYIKFDHFADPLACGRTAAAAITFMANVDAIIFDVRDNGGGDPRMVAFMSTYLFDQPIHLNDLYDRKLNMTTEYWTFRYVPGVRIGHKPAYVLTSSHTFSGAEEFAYDLKNLKRATIVGESTGGGSHPVAAHRSGDHFLIFVPGSRSINPISKTDWEGTGVVPDVAVKADDALDTAERLAAQKIQESVNTSSARAH